jgi:hypothetical protein
LLAAGGLVLLPLSVPPLSDFFVSDAVAAGFDSPAPLDVSDPAEPSDVPFVSPPDSFAQSPLLPSSFLPLRA